MRAGLRLKILVLLGALLLASFVPLYFAVATYTKLALERLRTEETAARGRVVAAHLFAESRGRGAELVRELAASELEAAGLLALGFYAQGQPPIELGAREALRRAPGAGVFQFTADETRLTLVFPIDERAGQAAPLLRLVGLYTVLVALTLLLVSYFALTRLIVRPLDQLTRTAERVAGGARRWTAPTTSVRELEQLGKSLGTMTESLIREEAALRRKIDEVEAATSNLKEAQHRLIGSERLASVGRLAAGLAHEIGNPISALMGLQDLLLAGGLEEAEQRDFIERMRRETERIHRILRDLLQFARPSGRSIAEPNDPGDVGLAIADTATLLAPQKSLKEITLKLDVEPDLPLVPLSREQLMQVLLNLVLNAADAAGPGGHIEIAARRAWGRVVLTVTDDGPGIAPEIRERLFEPFATTKDVGHGTGLGLAVCRGLVEAAGGSIAVADPQAPGATRDGLENRRIGAEFVISLPAADRDDRK